MLPDNETCYTAVSARDSRFDGVFYVAVRTTGIYCRPICPANTPRAENCTFYPSPGAAEGAGYRPCLRCRPEWAPGRASVDLRMRLAQAGAAAIDEDAGRPMADVAAGLGVSERHLRRAMHEEYGIPPVRLAQTRRLLDARAMLMDTRMPIAEVAYASGFRSVRRFNEIFQSRYGCAPTDIRRAAVERPSGGALRCRLGFRPPYDWGALIGFIGARTIPGVEAVSGMSYARCVSLRGQVGWIRAALHDSGRVLDIEVAESLAPVLPAVLGRLRRLFDTSADPHAISERLGPLAVPAPGLRVPGAFDEFEMVVRAILGQQISVAGARTLARRFALRFGSPVDLGVEGLDLRFPAPADVADAGAQEIRAIGMPEARARSIHSVAHELAYGGLVLRPGAALDRTLDRLRALPGIGEWTAQYVAMRALGWPDAFPHTDLGVYRALGTRNPREVLARAEQWRPWRAYAVMHLWTHGGMEL